MRRLTAALVLALGACAQPGAPPGGPPRHIPAKIVSIAPDSGATNAHVKEVEIQFDEVLAEKPAAQNATDLSGLALISPSDGPPHVGWHRERLTIKGKHDFRPNTAYTVTMMPGIADLHGNVLKTPITIVFSTGPTIPNTRISGIAFDWVTGKPIPNAMVQAIEHPDSIVYLARGDSLGGFVLPHAPPATYTMRVWNDANNNRLIDPHEVWDSAHVVLKDTARYEILAFAHDTVAPRIDQFAIMDSTALRVTFDRAIDTAQKLDTSMFIVKRADSSVVPLRGVERAAIFDSSRAANAPKDTSRADSIKKADSVKKAAAAPPTRGGRDILGGRAAADTAKHAPLPKPSRPSPVVEVVVLLAQPLRPGTSYRITARDVRSLLGFKASPSRVFTMPKPEPPSTKPEAHPPPKGRADTTKTANPPPKAKADTTKPPTHRP